MRLVEQLQQNRTLLWTVGLATVVVLLILGVLWFVFGFLSAIRGVIVILLFSALFSLLLNPLIFLLHRFLPRWLAVILGMLLFLALIGLLGYLLIPIVIQEIAKLQSNLPGITASFQNFLEQLDQQLQSLNLGLSLALLSQRLVEAVQNFVGPLIQNTLTFGFGVANFFVNFFFVLFISFFLLLDWPRFRRQLLSTLERYPRWNPLILDDLYQLVTRYLLALFFIATISGVFFGISTQLLGIQYAALIGLVSFFFEFIPYFGPLVPLVLALLLSIGLPPLTFLYVFLIWLGLRVLINNALTPWVMSRQFNLHPLVVILATLAGAALIGFWGAILAVPVVILLRTVWREFKRWTTPSPIEKTSEPAESTPPSPAD
jgi:predicted PurR-regulated permease PerM